MKSKPARGWQQAGERLRINTLHKNRDITLSFEVFPPKTADTYASVMEAVELLSRRRPDYISVTYAAGGGTSQNSIDIASRIQNQLGTTALAHLSCVSSKRDEIAAILDQLANNGVENILALRGDINPGSGFPSTGHYRYASELIGDIKKKGGFCVGAACYPEGHAESHNKEQDIDYLKMKVDSGCDFLITQMFFDNNVLYSFLYNALRNGIDIPVTAGIMPVTSAGQIVKMCTLANASLSPKFKAILDKFGDRPQALKQAGIAYATEQIVDLIANGIKGIHLYTMNKPDVAGSIVANLSGVLDIDTR